MTDFRNAALAAALLRISLGAVLLSHGLLKVFVFTVPGTVGFFGQLGLPAVLAYATIAVEVVGGLMLILGVLGRWVALAALPIMLGATWVHAGNGWLFTNTNGGWEYPLLLAVLCVVQALLGDGAYALRGSRADGAARLAPAR